MSKARAPRAQHWDTAFDAVPACPLCGGRDQRLWEAAIDGEGLHSVRVRCRACDLVYSNPQASEARMHAYYGRIFYDGMTFQGGDAPTLAAGVDPEQLQAIKAAEDLEFIGAELKGKSILDVGCASGYFLEGARKAGLKPQGLELSPKAAAQARARGFKVHVGSLERFKAGAKFDVVHCSHTVEHAKDPEAFLRRLGSLVKPGGRLYVECPNRDLLWVRIWRAKFRLRGEFPRLEHAREHTFDFTLPTLTRFHAKAGLKVLRAEVVDYPGGPFKLTGRPGEGLLKRALRRAFVGGSALLGLERRWGAHLKVLSTVGA